MPQALSTPARAGRLPRVDRRSLWRRLMLPTCALLTVACASLPARERLQQPDADPQAAAGARREGGAASLRDGGAASLRDVASQVTVRDQRGDLPMAAEVSTLKQVRAEGGGDAVEHHLRVLAATGEVDLYRHNATRLLVDGPATYAAMKAAVTKARHRVLLESYIIEDSTMADEMASLLGAKARQGVKVAVLYDAVGSIQADAAYFQKLVDHGVQVCKFNPINPLERIGYWGINHRNHRKVLVVDNEIAMTGGINISRTYARGSARGSTPGPAAGLLREANADDVLRDGWRDTHIELRGPVVPAIAEGFVRVWSSQGCPGGEGAALHGTALRPVAAAGSRVVKVVESDPLQPGNRIYSALLAAIEASRRSVHLTMAYFAPGEDMVQALCDAARRGVEVSLLLPGRSDFVLVLHAGRSYYERLLEAGVRVHEMDDAVMHAKTAVIDGVFSTVGSSNMDWRSFVDNNEINVIVLGDDFGAELEALFKRDLAVSRPIELESWRRRALGDRVLEGLGRLVERLL